MDFFIWLLQSIALAPYHLFLAIVNPHLWLDWGNPEALVRFIYYGGSVEFLFVVLTTFIAITALGMFWKRSILWGGVRGLEWLANTLGRVVAWVGLLMVLQQVMIVFLQRIFRVAEIQLGPLGTSFTRDLSWWSEELKLYNAMIVCLCVSYTVVQGGHVRVDIFYREAPVKRKALTDLVGVGLFLLPVCIMIFWVSFPYVADSWANLEGSQETSGIPGVFVLKTSILLFSVVLILQGISMAIHACLVLSGAEAPVVQEQHEGL